MGLVKCDDCGYDRSDQIDSICPNCGSKLEEEWWVSLGGCLLLGVLGFILLVALFLLGEWLK